MSMTWNPSGDNWLAATWVGDTQVLYLLTPGEHETWIVRSRVVGAKNPWRQVVGVQRSLDNAKDIAEYDEEQLQQKGF